MENKDIILNNNSKFNDEEIMQFIINDDPIDLLEIQANKLLKDIKRIIGIELDANKEQKIDDSFITSLKKMIIINNNQISDEYLTELSFVYFAQYNNTIDIYYKLKGLYDKIYYFMLDENLYNKVYAKEDDWTQFTKFQLEALEKAYKNGIYNELMSILRINSKIYFGHVNLDYLLEKERFLNLINTFGKQVIANSNMETIVKASLDQNINFSKQLVSINPNFSFISDIIFDSSLLDYLDINEIAFLPKEFINHLDYLKKINADSYILENYIKLIKVEPKFTFIKEGYEERTYRLMLEYYNGIGVITGDIYAKFSLDDRQKFIEVFNGWFYEETCSREQLRKFIKKLNKKYREPKPKALIKK